MEILLPRPIIIVANRKMNADRASLEAWRDSMANEPIPQGVIAVASLPYPYLQRSYLPPNICLSAQDCHTESSGAFTGSVSASMLSDVGVEYVIVGHSECRALGESNADIRQKAEAVLDSDMIPIICVGEDLPTRESGDAESFTCKQLQASLPMDTDNIIVAYEPIWAIGTGKSASAEDAQTMHSALRRILKDKVPILYGGSVNADNVATYMQQQDIDGVLVGSACLDPNSLASIINKSVV